jgi:hypothetical protein
MQQQGAPLIPPPPPRQPRRGHTATNGLLIGVAAFVLGAALGVAGYRWIVHVDTTFDYWVSIALG